MFHHEGLIQMTYVKTHSPWSASDQPTGKALNHLDGGQWAAIKADADLHSHDDRYYTKALSDSTFYTLATSVAMGMDADKLDNLHYSDLLAAILPIGSIMIWSGTSSNVPAGWHICDGGTYGGIISPDLRDRFVLGAGGSHAIGATGGPASWNGTITPAGSITVGSHALTLAELPSHGHVFTDYHTTATTKETLGSPANYPSGDVANNSNTSSVGGGGAHGHSGSSISFNAIDPRGKFRSLYYIIKYA
jgi:microcystin-dependent protein